MMNFFRHYDFLTLALLFSLPGLLIGALRPDLRRVMGRVIPFAIPFAFSEFLFYPSYWEPTFLFDLGRRLGFGIEDILFVSGLAAFTTTAYAFAFNRTYAGLAAPTTLLRFLRAAGLIGLAAALLAVLLATGVPVIYGACLAMAAAALVMLWQRPDLAVPCLLGGLVAALVYFLLCLALNALMPGIFTRIWYTEKFLNIFVIYVPLEELMYGLCAGAAATAFYPYIYARRFVRRAAGEAP